MLGSILFGLATPSEAAAVGALGGMGLAIAYRAMTWERLRESVYLTVRTTAMVCWLFVGSNTFASVFAYLGGQQLIADFVIGLDLTPLMFLIVAQIVIFILGWPLEWTEIIIIFVPIFLPLLPHFGIDPLFFGILVALNLQTAFLSPPMAMSAYYLKGIAPPHVTHQPDLRRLHAVHDVGARRHGDRLRLPGDRLLAAEPRLRPMNPALAGLGAVELRDRIARGALKAVDLAEALIARIAETEPELRAWAWHDPAFVRAQAEALDDQRGTGRPIGPLHGVPVGMKDIIDTARIPTENGTPLDAGRVPGRDAAVVERLRAAGALILGKTVTTELAFMEPPRTRNPAAPGRTPGGSSSGSAAAVAAGQVPLAVGTQTGGSVIRPAAFCGVVGFKPSFGAISRAGILAQSPSLDTVGVFAGSVRGCRAAGRRALRP